MKLQLVLPQEENYRPLPEGWWLPLGLLSIASYVKQIRPHVDIEILDGRRIPNKDIGKRLDADVIGFGPSVTSYLPAIRMAEEVKNRSPSSLIMFGGPYVTPIAEAVLANRPYIDAVVVHDGEEALGGIVRNRGLSAEIPNLVYRNSSGRTFIKTPRKELNLKEMPFPDVTLLSDMEKYWQDFWKTYPEYRGKKIVSTAAQRGCPYRAGKAGGCFFAAGRIKNTGWLILMHTQNIFWIYKRTMGRTLSKKALMILLGISAG